MLHRRTDDGKALDPTVRINIMLICLFEKLMLKEILTSSPRSSWRELREIIKEIASYPDNIFIVKTFQQSRAILQEVELHTQ